MQITAMFAKQIDRAIEGVVKADDIDNLAVEVDEYVLTRDAAKGIEPLLEEYTHVSTSNGVWISGFFGSGKSHLLKMLAHLLGDVPGQSFSREAVVEAFLDKTEDETLRALISRSASIPATSILFNIDQKTALISKDERQAVLRVFVKVFDEARGYYGGDPAVARFEAALDSRGKYEAFQEAFERLAGIPWTQGREQTAFERSKIDEAFSEVTGEEATGVIASYRASYTTSVEDFAHEVQGWLEQKPQGYRLNFFVDEVGQFIADDTRLMLNLQTVAETLNTVCRGRAWVFVTSQEDMEKVMGDRDKQQANDFSKIQARFATRVKLTSQDVEEVIAKRLLAKTPEAAADLERLYDEQQGNFSTLFSFGDGATTYRNYRDVERFTATYPFVTYQIPLFQKAREGLSAHNMFEGRNSSVGERSLLAVVQQVATRIRHQQLGSLASFDLMFDGMRGELKSAAQSAVLQAEQHLPEPGSDVTVMANRLLKALLLVKYVDSFKATPRNLAVLVFDHFGQDLPALNTLVGQALDLLERESYVQRNGNVYEYLTNEEQEIEKEIKNIELDSSEISSRLARYLSTDVLRSLRIRYTPNGQDFPFGLKLDDGAHGRQHDLTLHVLTTDYPASEEEVLAQSVGRDELRVLLPHDTRLLRDLRLVLMTEKYVKLRTSAGAPASTQVLLQAKQLMNSEREKELIMRLRSAVGSSRLIVNGADLSSTSSDPVARVDDGFQELVARVYRRLDLVVDIDLGEADVPRLLNTDPALLERDMIDRDALAPAGEEIMAFLARQSGGGQQVTLRKIIDQFEAKPYGWRLGVIEALVAWLLATGKVSLTQDSTAVSRAAAANVITNTAKHPYVVVAAREEYEHARVSALRTFCTDFLDANEVPMDPEELGCFAAERLEQLRGDLRALMGAEERFPFVRELEEPCRVLDQVCGHDPQWYLKEFDAADELIELNEDLIRPIVAFVRGNQGRIYTDARVLLTSHRENLEVLRCEAAERVTRMLEDPRPFLGNKMPPLKAATEELRTQIDTALQEARDEVAALIEQRRSFIQTNPAFAQAASDVQQDAMRRVDREIARLATEDRLDLIRHLGEDFVSHKLPDILNSLTPKKTDVDLPVVSTRTNDTPEPAPPSSWVSLKTVDISTRTGVPTTMSTTDEVDAYLRLLREELLEILRSGRGITL